MNVQVPRCAPGVFASIDLVVVSTCIHVDIHSKQRSPSTYDY